MTTEGGPSHRLRWWFDDPSNPDRAAAYVGQYLNYGLTLEEL